MYGTVGRLKVKPGALEDLLAALRRNDERQVDGFIGYWLYRVEGSEDDLVLAVAFRDRESYFRNADDPAQDAAYREMVSHLQGPPAWEDGEIVAAGPA